MVKRDYTIVFKKHEEALLASPDLVHPAELNPNELDEINELRRLALEISNPERTSYTST
jgi:hypothetical protein